MNEVADSYNNLEYNLVKINQNNHSNVQQISTNLVMSHDLVRLLTLRLIRIQQNTIDITDTWNVMAKGDLSSCVDKLPTLTFPYLEPPLPLIDIKFN